MKVLISGTFDVLHLGHIHFIQEAASLGEVHVIVACDQNCQQRGKDPIFSEQERVEMLNSIKGIKKVYLGREDNNAMKMIKEIKPDIILIGPNQNYDLNKLQVQLKDQNLRLQVKKSTSFYDKYPLGSSSLVKRAIFQNISESRKLDSLYPSKCSFGNFEKQFFIFGKVIQGSGYAGKVLECPTANLDIDVKKLNLNSGVYRVLVSLGLESQLYRGLMYIGNNKCEVHLFEFDGRDLYGSFLKVEILNFLRESMDFSQLSLEEIKKIVQHDLRKP